MFVFLSSWQIVNSIHEVEISFCFLIIKELLAVIADKSTVKLEYFLYTITNRYVCDVICQKELLLFYCNMLPYLCFEVYVL